MTMTLAAEPTVAEVSVQWKGTDVCFDFVCACGAKGHFDGEFAYAVQCGVCGAKYDLPTTLTLKPYGSDYGIEFKPRHPDMDGFEDLMFALNRIFEVFDVVVLDVAEDRVIRVAQRSGAVVSELPADVLAQLDAAGYALSHDDGIYTLTPTGKAPTSATLPLPEAHAATPVKAGV